MGIQWTKLGKRFYVVDADVSEDHSVGSSTGSIADAYVDMPSSSGGTIQLLSGEHIFPSNWAIHKPNVHIRGVGRSSVLMIDDGLLLSANRITFDNLSIICTGGISDRPGLEIADDANEVTIKNCYFYDFHLYAIQIAAARASITGNHFYHRKTHSASRCITNTGSDAESAIIRGNTFQNSGEAVIDLVDMPHNIISGNHFYNTLAASTFVKLTNCDHTNITNNSFDSKCDHTDLFPYVYIADQQGGVITSNLWDGNGPSASGGTGIHFGGGCDSLVYSGNHFSNLWNEGSFVGWNWIILGDCTMLFDSVTWNTSATPPITPSYLRQYTFA